MKKNTVVKFVLVLLVILAAIGLGLSRNKRAKGTGGGNLQDDNRALEEKAKQARHFVGDEAPNMNARFADLEQLSAHSGAVVIGTPQKNVCRLSADGKSATIDYDVKIEYVMKGNLKEADHITVKLPGGSVSFADGSSAEVRTPWFRKMQQGSTYLLFLTETGGARAYVTTGQAQGVWEIPTTTKTRAVKSHTGIMNDPMWRYQNADVKTFLKEVRKSLNKNVKG